MKYLKISLLYFLLLLSLHTVAQTAIVPVFKGATKTGRDKTYDYLIKKSITQNLSLPLSDSTEEDWEDAFYALELINYKQPWVNEKIKIAFAGIDKRSIEFQRALLELTYTNYRTQFQEEVLQFYSKTLNAKNFAMAGEYLYRADSSMFSVLYTIGLNRAPIIKAIDSSEKVKSILNSFEARINNKPDKKFNKKIKNLFINQFLLNNTVVYSIQRKDRNYPGIVIVKDKTGNFVTDDSGNIFSVSQLARSITNLPSYLTNGNTPQGIFRLYGFAVSKSPALGPTENLQLTMPYETSIQHFLKDSSITDTVWTAELYKKLLPESLRDQYALYGTFYASQAGRTEVIAHGTTVDPDYYKGQTYYPYTPTQGCLCTKEIWSAVDGKRVISDQQKLADAVKKAGGADGYLIVIEIDDQQKAVSLDEVLPFLKR